jgi:hypothetical protein
MEGALVNELPHARATQVQSIRNLGDGEKSFISHDRRISLIYVLGQIKDMANI